MLIVLERIPLTEIYDLCKKVMQHYTIINQDMELSLMKIFAEYQKRESILASIMEFAPRQSCHRLLYPATQCCISAELYPLPHT